MRKYLYLAAGVGVIGVAAGAFGAHVLKESLQAKVTINTWNTAVLYNLIHAPALLAASLYASTNPSYGKWLQRAAACWAIGVGLFSGSLYFLALGGPHWLGPITPLGGIFLILGWLCVAGVAGKSGQIPHQDV
ncbi:MAG: DUF423 domain-containing protein [Opitutaceae bacterium]|jgi:uncharacterized membrane protein YgdD (TMEM256/DUF423 family)